MSILTFAVVTTAILAPTFGLKANPLPPVYSGQLIKVYDFIDPDEGTSHPCSEYFDTPNNRMMFNCSSPYGMYAQLTRCDLGMGYIYYYSSGSMLCYPYTTQCTLPASLPLTGVYYVKDATVRGRAAHIFRDELGKYVSDYFIDAVTGAILRQTNWEFSEAIQETISFQNATQPNPAVFNVPTACTSSKRMPQPAPRRVSKADLLKQLKLHATGKRSYTIDARMPQSELIFPTMNSADVELLKSLGVQEYRPNPSTTLPPAIDNQPYATPVRDQAICGCCWAFSSCAAMEIVSNIANKRLMNGTLGPWLSVQSLVDCVHGDLNGTYGSLACKGCMGGNPGVALYMAAHQGIPLEQYYTYDEVTGSTCRSAGLPVQHPISTLALVQNNVTLLKTAVVEQGAFVALINIYPDWMWYSQGVYDNPACTPGYNHAVAVMGYGYDEMLGMEYWKVKNSFGGNWGEGGYFRIRLGVNMCGIEDVGFIPIA